MTLAKRFGSAMTNGATRRSKLILFSLLTAGLHAQTQSFDAYTYDAPAGYNLRTHAEAVELTKIDQRRRTYCQIGLYRAQPSTGSAAQDMDKEWQAVVTKQFRVTSALANKEIPLPNAPTSLVRGAEAVDGNGNKTVSSLFVLRFPERYVGVLFNASNAEAFQGCQEDATKVVLSVKMVAGARLAAPAPSSQISTSSGGITGVWQRVVASQTAGRYNPFTKAWEYDPVSAMNQFRHTHRYQFDANGQYTYELDAEDYNRSQRSRVIERGTYTAANGVVQFQPRERREGVGPKNTDPPLSPKPAPAAYARRFQIGEHPTYKDSAGLQLQTSDGNYETYKPVR